MRGRALLALAVASMVASPAARAEVRLERDRGRGAGVRITTARGGVWSATGNPDTLTLNADGDLLGDGSPAHASADGVVLAAWASPSHGGLRLALGREAWTELPILPATDGRTQPLVTSLGTAWLVTWSTERNAGLALVRADGRVDQLDAQASGTAVALATVGTTVHLITRDEAGLLTQHVFSVIIDDNPIIFFKIGDAILTAALAPPMVRSASTEEGDPWVLAWWSAAGRLEAAALREDEIIGEIRTFEGRGRSASPQALVREAMRSFAPDGR